MKQGDGLVNAKSDGYPDCHITDILYSAKHDHIVICTKQDVRLVDCITGK
jgi:hypothetical protein